MGYLDKTGSHTADLAAHTRDYLETRRTGEYLLPLGVVGTASAITVTVNTLYATPFIVARDMTIDRLAIHIFNNVGSGNARLGIYKEGINLYPGDLLLNAGTVSLATDGVKAITISQALVKGLYWMAFVADTSVPIRSTSSGAINIGINASNFDIVNYGGWTVAHTYGALPDPFTAGGALVRHTMNIAPRLLTND